MIITKTPFRISFCGGGSDMGGLAIDTKMNYRYSKLLAKEV